MATGTPTRTLTIALLGTCLSGCSALTALFQGSGDRAVTTVEKPISSSAPASNTSSNTATEARIPRLTERAGASAHDAGEETKDLWDRLRTGLRFSGADRPEVQKEIEFYSNYKKFIERSTQRARPYLHYIVTELERRQMPVDLALLPIVESAFQPHARSRRGAVGIWQFIPATGRRFGLERNKWYDGRRDVIASTNAALDYLQQLHDQFNGDWLSAVAAYNCGERNVERAIAANAAAGKPTDFWSLNLPAETRLYVPRLLALTTIVSSPLRYNVQLEAIANEPYLAIVDVPQQIDLRKAADAAGISEEEMRALNPAFLSAVTAPKGTHRVVVPLARADLFRTALAQRIADLAPSRGSKRALAAETGGATRTHRIEKGDSLSSIASRYDVTVEALQALNEVNPRRLKLGQTLLVPVNAADGDIRDNARVAQSEPAATTAASAAGTRVIHTVRAGDSLWTIARSYDVRVNDLCAWNDGFSPKAVLRLNQRLVVWTRTEDEGGNIADGALLKTSTELPSDGSFKLVRYEIQYGDSLWTIAQRFKVSIDRLRLWNGIREDSVLKPGDNIDVYVVSTTDPEGRGLRI